MKKAWLVFTGIAILFVLGCKNNSGSQQTTAGAGGANAAHEAPEFAQLVKEGKLPPLAERLPKNPLVVTPRERVGVYGGTWRLAMVGGNLSHMNRHQNYENLVRWSPGWGEVIPDVAESWEVSPDSRVYTFHLREGMKWSDGQPFSADDILFYFEDVAADKLLTPSPPAHFRQGGELVKVEKLGPYTIRYSFPEPNGLFLQQLALVDSSQGWLPKHYFSKVILKYNPNMFSWYTVKRR